MLEARRASTSCRVYILSLMIIRVPTKGQARRLPGGGVKVSPIFLPTLLALGSWTSSSSAALSVNHYLGEVVTSAPVPM